ncbi:hypothetical protein LCGC14_0485050 [marine sediment metagenome]|uniref:Uncharacterized protein n=1 Tax=marine sediment metagenome TaxID=412755 RepID=A0A0F9SRI2_9ZZZZ
MTDAKTEAWKKLKEELWKEFRIQQYNNIRGLNTNPEEHAKFSYMAGLDDGRVATMKEAEEELEIIYEACNNERTWEIQNRLANLLKRLGDCTK